MEHAQWYSDSTKKWILVLAAAWSLLSLIGGINFIRKNYEIAVSSPHYYHVSRIEQIIWGAIAYIISVILIYFISVFVVKAICYDGKERKILLYSLPVFIIMASYFLTDISSTHIKDYYVGDEKNIWDAAVQVYPFFFVYTSELFLICFFVIPTIVAPSIVKIISISLVIGYIIFRAKERYKTNLSFLIYLPLLFKPIYEVGIRVHRMYWYGVMYIFFAVKIYFDSENKIDTINNDIKNRIIIFMSFVIAVLTVLRREGIYLLVFGAALMILTYAKEKNIIIKQHAIRIFLVFIILEVIVYYPASRSGLTEKGTTYRAFFVHILGERSFDREKAEEELEAADKYMNIDIIDKYNNDQGIYGFEDCMYDWPEWSEGKYYALRPDAAITAEEFSHIVLDIIQKQPLVFIKSRIRAFGAAANSPDSYNLFLPLFLLAGITIYSVKEKKAVLCILSVGVIIHIGITTLTMPASYFKYFYEMYLFAYFFTIIIIIELAKNNGELIKETGSKE